MSIWSELKVLNLINKDNYWSKYQLNKDRLTIFCQNCYCNIYYHINLYYQVLCMSKML